MVNLLDVIITPRVRGISYKLSRVFEHLSRGFNHLLGLRFCLKRIIKVFLEIKIILDILEDI